MARPDVGIFTWGVAHWGTKNETTHGYLGGKPAERTAAVDKGSAPGGAQLAGQQAPSTSKRAL